MNVWISACITIVVILLVTFLIRYLYLKINGNANEEITSSLDGQRNAMDQSYGDMNDQSYGDMNDQIYGNMI